MRSRLITVGLILMYVPFAACAIVFGVILLRVDEAQGVELPNLVGAGLLAGLAAGVILVIRKRRLLARQRPGLCLNCGYDLRASRERCPECGTPIPVPRRRRLKRLREDWPANPVKLRTPGADEQTTAIHETIDGMEADLLQQHLEARGIPCRLETQTSQPRGGARVPLLHRLHAWSADADAAREIVRRLMNG